MQYYHTPRGPRPCRRHPSWRSPWHRKSMKKGMQKRIAQKIPLWAPCWRLRRPKRSIVANLAPKMTPKWSPKWSRGNNGRSSRNMRRHERIACPPPPWGAPFSLIFLRPQTKHQKVNIITPICEPGSKMIPKVPLQGPKMNPKILQKASTNHL